MLHRGHFSAVSWPTRRSQLEQRVWPAYCAYHESSTGQNCTYHTISTAIKQIPKKSGIQERVGVIDWRIKRSRWQAADHTERPPPLFWNLSEWGAANCRIMNCLLVTGALNRANIEYYLAYTTTLFSFVEKFRWHSILDFDFQYRELQAEHNFQWGTLMPSLEPVSATSTSAASPRLINIVSPEIL